MLFVPELFEPLCHPTCVICFVYVYVVAAFSLAPLPGRLRFCVRYGGDDDGIGATAVVINSSAQVIDHAAMLLLIQ